MQHNKRYRIHELATFLSRERAQTMPEYTLTLSVISGTSVLGFTKLSESSASVITGMVRLFT